MCTILEKINMIFLRTIKKTLLLEFVLLELRVWELY